MGNSQVLVVDIQEPLSSVQIKHQEEFQYGDLDEKNMNRDVNLFDIYFEEGQVYHVIVNSDYHFTFRAVYYDDVLVDFNDFQIICNCAYNIEDHKLILQF
jgi:hypothetical protein